MKKRACENYKRFGAPKDLMRKHKCSHYQLDSQFNRLRFEPNLYDVAVPHFPHTIDKISQNIKASDEVELYQNETNVFNKRARRHNPHNQTPSKKTKKEMNCNRCHENAYEPTMVECPYCHMDYVSFFNKEFDEIGYLSLSSDTEPKNKPKNIQIQKRSVSKEIIKKKTKKQTKKHTKKVSNDIDESKVEKKIKAKV